MSASEPGVPATFDHVTVAVFDLDEAIRFFGVLGFEVIKSVRISGATMAISQWLETILLSRILRNCSSAIPSCGP